MYAEDPIQILNNTFNIDCEKSQTINCNETKDKV